MKEYDIEDWNAIKVKTVESDVKLETIIKEYLHSRDVQVERTQRIIDEYADLISLIAQEQLALLDKEISDRLKVYHPELV